MLLTIVLLTSVVCLVASYLWTLKSRYNYFEQHGIPGPPPLFFLDNYHTLWSVPRLKKQLQRWTQQYGSIYGLFQGSRPTYVVSDVDFLQEVYVKQFALFHSRCLPFIMKRNTGYRVNLLGTTGVKRLRQRYVINPTFSAAKLK